MGLFDAVKSIFQKPKRAFTSAVVVAAGDSTRMGLSGQSKQLMELRGMPVIAYTLKAFEMAATIDEVIIVAKSDDIYPISQIVQEFGYGKVKKVVVGGTTRTESVQSGIAELNSEAKYVAIQDGARPFVRAEKIDLAVNTAYETGAAALGVPVKDTLKMADSSGNIVKTVNRDGLFQIQTPQVFELAGFRDALMLCIGSKKSFTDDCQLFEMTGRAVKIVPGDYDNIKLTYPDDLQIASAIVGGMLGE